MRKIVKRIFRKDPFGKKRLTIEFSSGFCIFVATHFLDETKAEKALICHHEMLLKTKAENPGRPMMLPLKLSATMPYIATKNDVF